MTQTTYCHVHNRLEPFVELEEIPIADDAALEFAVYNARPVKVIVSCGARKNLVTVRS